MLLATALRRARVISRPKTAMVRLSAGLNGAKLMAIRMRLNNSAGFLPVSANSSLRISCKFSVFQSLRLVSLVMACLSKLSSSDSESFLRNLLLISISKSMRGSSKKYVVMVRRSDKVLRRS